MKLAFVKQDVYQDLYVCGPSSSPDELLFSSIMRVGPIGLFTLFGADFFIVKEEETPECGAWRKIIPHYPAEWFRMLKDRPFSATAFPETRFFQPGSAKAHNEFSVYCADVNWAAYDVVICINFAVPSFLVRQYPSTLWCYMIGEANMLSDRVYADYDVCLNQEARGIVADKPGVVDFPYTFMGARCLERIMEKALGRSSLRRGVYIEINSISERPVKDAGSLAVLARPEHPIRLHQQSIKANLEELFDSKYFVKVGGRKIRGNSVIEAISCGVVVLMNPAELHHSQLLPKEGWIYSVEDAQRKISELESDPHRYEQLRAMQRTLLQTFVCDMPIESLANCLNWKRSPAWVPKDARTTRPSLLQRVKSESRTALRRALRPDDFVSS